MLRRRRHCMLRPASACAAHASARTRTARTAGRAQHSGSAHSTDAQNKEGARGAAAEQAGGHYISALYGNFGGPGARAHSAPAHARSHAGAQDRSPRACEVPARDTRCVRVGGRLFSRVKPCCQAPPRSSEQPAPTADDPRDTPCALQQGQKRCAARDGSTSGAGARARRGARNGTCRPRRTAPRLHNIWRCFSGCACARPGATPARGGAARRAAAAAHGHAGEFVREFPGHVNSGNGTKVGFDRPGRPGASSVGIARELNPPSASSEAGRCDPPRHKAPEALPRLAQTLASRLRGPAYQIGAPGRVVVRAAASSPLTWRSRPRARSQPV